MFASKTIFKRIRISEQKWLDEAPKYLRGKKHETASDNVWLQSIKESFHVFTKRKRKEKSFYPLKKYKGNKFRIHLHFGMLPNTKLFLLSWSLLNIPFLFASLKQWHINLWLGKKNQYLSYWDLITTAGLCFCFLNQTNACRFSSSLFVSGKDLQYPLRSFPHYLIVLC